jgi:hypothetical protein
MRYTRGIVQTRRERNEGGIQSKDDLSNVDGATSTTSTLLLLPNTSCNALAWPLNYVWHYGDTMLKCLVATNIRGSLEWGKGGYGRHSSISRLVRI